MTTAIGWMLVHSLWQGTLVALMYAPLRTLIPESHPQLRYALACIALLFVPALPIAWTVSAVAPAWSAPVLLRPDGPGIVSCLTYLWLAGVAVCSTRLFYGSLQAERLAREAPTLRDARWRNALLVAASRLGVSRCVRLLASYRVDTPTVIGWIRPAILVPAGILAGLPGAQLEAILAHELAHIRRHDYLVNSCQCAIEALLFYHPAVWWLSRQVRIEREFCCDDLAVAACGDRMIYARALAQCEARRRLSNRPLSVAATGSSLLQRIRRITGTGTRSEGFPASMLAAALAPAVLAAALVNNPWPATDRDHELAERLAELAHHDFLVRDHAISVLGELKDRRAVEPLLLLLGDPNVYIRDNAIAALGHIGDVRAVDSLISMLRDSNVYLRDNAITALGEIKDQRAVLPLIGLLTDANVYIRDNAAAALGHIGDPRAIAPLEAALKDANGYVRHTVAESLLAIRKERP